MPEKSGIIIQLKKLISPISRINEEMSKTITAMETTQ